MRTIKTLAVAAAIHAAFGVSALAVAADGKTHVVQEGQTLHLIAMQYGMSWKKLAEINGIENPDDIKAGMTLKLPDDAVVPRAVPPSNAMQEEKLPAISHAGNRDVSEKPKVVKGPPAPSKGGVAPPPPSGSDGIARTRVFEVQPDTTIEVKVSKDDVNRLSVRGGRIEEVFGASEHLLMKGDDARGQVFFRFNPEKKGNSRRYYPVSLFVSDDRGATYTVVLRPNNQSSTSVVLKPTFGPLPNAIDNERTTTPDTPYQDRLMSLIQAMYRNADTPRYEATERGVTTKRWDGLPMVLVRDWTGDRLLGREYLVKNTHDHQTMRLTEAEFSTKGVLAVAIDHHELAPEQVARVFVVQQAGGR